MSFVLCQQLDRGFTIPGPRYLLSGWTFVLAVAIEWQIKIRHGEMDGIFFIFYFLK